MTIIILTSYDNDNEDYYDNKGEYDNENDNSGS